MHTDREYVYKVMEKYLRVDDRKLLEASYNVEIKALEPRLAMKPEGFQSALDEIAPTEPRAKAVKPQEMIDTRYLDEMERSGFLRSDLGGEAINILVFRTQTRVSKRIYEKLTPRIRALLERPANRICSALLMGHYLLIFLSRRAQTLD